MSDSLRQRILDLEAEVARLKEHIAQLERNHTPQEKPAPPLLGNVHNKSPVEKKIELYRSLFRGRNDVYATRWENRAKGIAGYAPVYQRNGWKVVPKNERKYLPLTNSVITAHLRGEAIVGIYPVLDDDRCFFLAADFDKSKWREDCSAYLQASRKLGVDAYLECSRSVNGGHVWIFFVDPVPASSARKLGSAIITKAMELRPTMGLDSYDRLFPSQDNVPKGGFGNLIALPLQKKSRDIGGSVFLDPSLVPYTDQWSFFSSVKKVTADRLESIVAKAQNEGDLLGVRWSFSDEAEILKPWELKPSERFCTAPLAGELPKQISVTVSNLLFIEKEGLPPSLLNRLIRLAAFHNPEFYQAQAMRFSTFGKPRLVHCAEEFPHHIGLHRGCVTDLETLCEAHSIELSFTNKRNKGNPLACGFTGELRAEQRKAVRSVLKFDDGIICAATAFGKTVVAAHLIAKRGVNTLIIVHRRQLLDQWKQRLCQFLDLEESDIGQAGAGKTKLSGKIDIAIMQSLNRKGDVKDFVADYGHVIVDECHHVSAFSFEQVMKKVKAQFVLGLTATPERKDGHHPILFMQCGAIRYRMSAKQQAKIRGA